MTLRDGIRPVTPIIEPSPEDHPSPFDLARQAQAARDETTRTFTAHEQALDESDRLGKLVPDLERRASEIRLRTICRILEECGTGKLEPDTWYTRLEPIAAVRRDRTWLAVVPNFGQNFYEAKEGPELAEFCTLVVLEDPRDDESTAPDPDPIPAASPADAVLRDTVLRLIGWWESARIAAMDAHALPCPDIPRAEDRAFVEARHLAERTAREAEALLGTAILHLVGGRPPTFGAEDFALEALRPAAVEFGGVCYTVVSDPHEALNGDCSTSLTMPIVARVESGRVVALG